MNCEFVFRPLGDWPNTKTRHPKSAVFRSRYEQTLELLDKELLMLKVRKAIIQIDLLESQIRNDGLPRSGARPQFQGVILSFESKYGPLKYATDVFSEWKDNLRAIALGLEALRKVDRYGITKKGEQYTGWKALPAAITEIADVYSAAEFIQRFSGRRASDIIEYPSVLCEAYKKAALKLHPDKGGSNEQFDLLNKARRLIEDAKSSIVNCK